MTQEQALAILKANIEFSKKPMPTFGTEAHDDYRIEMMTLEIRAARAAKEHPGLFSGKPDPRATPAIKL